MKKRAIDRSRIQSFPNAPVHNRVENWWKCTPRRLRRRAQSSIPAGSPMRIEQSRARPRIFAFFAFLFAGARRKNLMRTLWELAYSMPTPECELDSIRRRVKLVEFHLPLLELVRL
jgi:hypothetical protein